MSIPREQQFELREVGSVDGGGEGIEDDGEVLGPSADLFLATFRRMPTAIAEGLDRIGGRRRNGLGRAAPFDALQIGPRAPGVRRRHRPKVC